MVYFCSRLENFNEWMVGVESTLTDLEQQNLSTKEYKQILTKFKVSHIGVKEITGMSTNHRRPNLACLICIKVAENTIISILRSYRKTQVYYINQTVLVHF